MGKQISLKKYSLNYSTFFLTWNTTLFLFDLIYTGLGGLTALYSTALYSVNNIMWHNIHFLACWANIWVYFKFIKSLNLLNRSWSWCFSCLHSLVMVLGGCILLIFQILWGGRCVHHHGAMEVAHHRRWDRIWLRWAWSCFILGSHSVHYIQTLYYLISWIMFLFWNLDVPSPPIITGWTTALQAFTRSVGISEQCFICSLSLNLKPKQAFSKFLKKPLIQF